MFDLHENLTTNLSVEDIYILNLSGGQLSNDKNKTLLIKLSNTYINSIIV